MTKQELIEYLVDTHINCSGECPPDGELSNSVCTKYADCPDCWKSFINNRFKKYKLQKKGH